MKQYWSKWTQCKNKPDLKGCKLTDTEIHDVDYKVIVFEFYNTDRWDPKGKEIRCTKEYTKEEWNELQKSKNSILRLRDNAQNNS